VKGGSASPEDDDKGNRRRHKYSAVGRDHFANALSRLRITTACQGTARSTQAYSSTYEEDDSVLAEPRSPLGNS
jgi:hypothetical protein